MTFEGIVINRVPYKERDLIVKLLLRQGLIGSFYVYGGQGGGKFHKPTIFELGSMIRILTKDQKKNLSESSELMISAEHQRVWEPQSVRHDIRAYYLICLYFELVQKFSLPFHPWTSGTENQEHEGVFAVLSNALFYLEDALKKGLFRPEQQLSLFLIKLLYHLGIMPDTDHCSYCQKELLELHSVIFLPSQGQFACYECASGENEKGFLMRMKLGFQTRYQDYTNYIGASFNECDKLLLYFCHQYQLRPMELKTYSLLFK
jgi:recombinational DNA repair protein (RecF pathway)